MHKKNDSSNLQQKEIPRIRDTRKAYTILLYRRGLTTHPHTTPKKRKMGLPFCVVLAGPLGRGVSRQNGARSVSSAREARGLSTSNPFFHNSPSKSPTSRTTLSNNSSNNPSEHSSNNPSEPLLEQPVSTHTLRSASPPPPSFVPRPFWACLRSLGQSGQRTRLLRVNVTEGGAFPPLYFADSLGLQAGSLFTYSALLSRAPTLRREIAPRLRRASIPPRGDRVHTVPLVGVCGEGGGVVASLMGVVWS